MLPFFKWHYDYIQKLSAYLFFYRIKVEKGTRVLILYWNFLLLKAFKLKMQIKMYYVFKCFCGKITFFFIRKYPYYKHDKYALNTKAKI